MKKNKISVLLMAVALVMTGTFSSCNKKLKEEIKDLDKQVEDLKAQQATTNSNLNATNNTLGFNSPFSMSLTTKNGADSTIVVNKTYKYWTGDDYTSMENNHDGTYNVYLYVTEAAYWDNDAYLYFVYNPTTKVVTNGVVNMDYIDYEYSNKTPTLSQADTEATVTFNVTKFDTSTGVIDVTISGSTTNASASNVYTGKAMTLSFHYVGTLAVFQ